MLRTMQAHGNEETGWRIFLRCPGSRLLESSVVEAEVSAVPPRRGTSSPLKHEVPLAVQSTRCGDAGQVHVQHVTTIATERPPRWARGALCRGACPSSRPPPSALGRQTNMPEKEGGV